MELVEYELEEFPSGIYRGEKEITLISSFCQGRLSSPGSRTLTFLEACAYGLKKTFRTIG